MAELFNEEIISQATHTKWAGKTVHFAREIDSTNLWGKRAWKEEGVGHGELFVAEYQSCLLYTSYCLKCLPGRRGRKVSCPWNV